MSSMGRIENRNQEVSAISRGLKLGRRIGSTVLGVIALSRASGNVQATIRC
jgi:hypothetical protein